MPSLEILIPSLVILVLSLSFHEAAHAWTATRLGDPTARALGRLTLNPLAHIDWIGTVVFPLLAMYSNLPIIGWAKPVPVNIRNLRAPRRDFAVVAAAGPTSNLIIAVAAAALLAAAGDADAVKYGAGTWLDKLLFYTVVMNVMLAIFNMLPIPPLDGGNVLAGFVPESVARAIDQLRPWGFLLLYAMLFLGVLDRLVFPVGYLMLDWLL